MTVQQYNRYDVIIVGAGTAGSVLAARLTEDPAVSVLLLEAGSGEPLHDMAIPAAWPTLAGTTASWGDTTVPQGSSPVGTPLPRGKGVGGSSSINAMLFTRGHRTSYRRWVDAGATGWGYDDLLPYFERVESAPQGASTRGRSGPVQLSTADPVNPVLAAALDGATEAGYPRALDISSGLEEGFGPVDLNIVGGHRQSAADAYLQPARSRSNLDIVPDALVRRIDVNNGRAAGATYAVGTTSISASAGEVVLSAGAIGTPQLLMLSGIGPQAHLREHDIDIVADLPGVGVNLQDHPAANIIYRTRRPVPRPGFNHGEVIGLLRSRPDLDGPDLQLIFVDLPRPIRTFDTPDQGFSIGVSVILPHSRGSVRLRDGVPGSAPIIDPAYLRDARDLEAMTAGLRVARRIGATPALSEWVEAEAIPGPATTADADLRAYACSTVSSYCHPVGTAAMGNGDNAVVDPSLRVHGIDGLRVVDASVMPAIPSGNTNATVYAIAERAAEVIRATASR